MVDSFALCSSRERVVFALGFGGLSLLLWQSVSIRAQDMSSRHRLRPWHSTDAARAIREATHEKSRRLMMTTDAVHCHIRSSVAVSSGGVRI